MGKTTLAFGGRKTFYPFSGGKLTINAGNGF
jgi:hypothetical protein